MIYSFAIYKNGNLEPSHLPSPKVISGWKTWQDYNCQSCHQLYGLGGFMGPDLTNETTHKGRPYLKVMIQWGSAKMPNFHLKEYKVDEILDFLAWVDSSGTSKIPAEAVQWTGNYKLQER